MLIKFAIHTIGRKKFRTFLAVFSVMLGVGSLLVFAGINKGVRTATFEEFEKRSPMTQITVRPPVEKGGIVSFITRSDEHRIKPNNIEEISGIRWVEDVYPNIQFNNFASLEIRIFGRILMTDAMIFGVPKGFIEDDIADPNLWDISEEPYPAIIPRQILSIYNLTVAGPQNLPVLSENALIGRSITLYPNYSTFFPSVGGMDDKVELEVVGFSDRVNLIGATLPFEVVENLNIEYTGTPESPILELFVEVEDASRTVAVAERIEEMGFDTFYFQKDIEGVEARFDYLRNSLGAISAVIILMAAVAIMSTFLATISERTREIGLFRSLGATKKHVKRLILAEAGIVGVLGAVPGVLLGLLGGGAINRISFKEFEHTALEMEKLFLADLKMVLAVAVFGVVLSVLAAYFPAKKAASIPPIEALNR